jgi:DNA-binding transcriptional LysR family regulator
MAKRRAPPRSDLDLNLLGVLDALLAERSVTRAADRVGLSQSAASHALGRLRDHFGDPLLVRTNTGMVLTARGKELAGPIRDALASLDGALRDARTFDARRATRRFAIAMTDYLGAIVLPLLYTRIAREAPGIDLTVTSVVRSVEDTLETESVDLVVSMAALADDRPGLYQQRLFEERYVCVVRRGHPAAGRALTADAYCALDHVLIAPRGGRGIVDRQLAARGLTRRVAVQVPHWLVAPHLVANSDLVLTVVERLARRYASMLDLAVVELPIDVPATACWQRWHERSHGDSAHVWLRARVAEVAAALV